VRERPQVLGETPWEGSRRRHRLLCRVKPTWHTKVHHALTQDSSEHFCHVDDIVPVSDRRPSTRRLQVSGGNAQGRGWRAHRCRQPCLASSSLGRAPTRRFARLVACGALGCPRTCEILSSQPGPAQPSASKPTAPKLTVLTMRSGTRHSEVRTSRFEPIQQSGVSIAQHIG